MNSIQPTPISPSKYHHCEKEALVSTTYSPCIAMPKLYDQRLKYDIHACSSYSASYLPQNILLNKPQDQSSRWSSGSNNQAQFITVKFDKMAIPQTMTFGKYHKVHVCNLKEFKVYGGLDPDNLLLMLHAGLRNDTEPETFSLKHIFNQVVVPCRYLKIVPLLAHGANFNFSIWYVEIRGSDEPAIVENAFHTYTKYKETEALRLCMKHFRQRNLFTAFHALQEQSGLHFEDPILTDLHKCVVMEGDFDSAEHVLNIGCDRRLYDECISEHPYRPVWKRIYPPPHSNAPCMRGGHQMCIDVEEGKIYLFGGWDGSKDLADFWCYDQSEQVWTCLSTDTRRNNGPGPRSCHKICFDSKTRQLFVLGRYVDPDSRPNVNLESDFWAYHTDEGKWKKMSSNTAMEGGPDLIYDHQMVIDHESSVLYVFGGRTISPDSGSTVYSGLYAYDISINRWRLLRTDTSQPEYSIQLRSRIGHSMLFNSSTRQLYIFAGQRNKDYLSDFYIYDIESDTVHEVSRDYSVQGGPAAGFTQRATIDPQLGEIYVLSGLMREKNNSSETVKNSFWVYNIPKQKWTRVYQNENSGLDYWQQMADLEPCPRFAHQMVYDYKRGKQFLFGGNPGEVTSPNLRLDDFWQLTLQRPVAADILRKAKFHIRKQKFKELCQNPMVALDYLQSHVSAVVNHHDDKETEEFKELTFHLFAWGHLGVKEELGSSKLKSAVDVTFEDVRMGEGSAGGLLGGKSRKKVGNLILDTEAHLIARTELYEHLLEYFPISMKQPTGNLVDLIPLL